MNRRTHTKSRRFLSVPSNKRAQMEMVGLVIIVILITLGILFMATFTFNSKSSKKIATYEQLHSSTVSAILKTTVSEEADCTLIGSPQIGADIIDDCVEFIDTDSRYNCIGPKSKKRLHSCDFLEEAIADLLERSLGIWNYKYEFYIQSEPFPGAEKTNVIKPVVTSKGGCPKGRNRDSSKVYSISTDVGNVNIFMFLCN